MPEMPGELNQPSRDCDSQTIRSYRIHSDTPWYEPFVPSHARVWAWYFETDPPSTHPRRP